MANRRTQKQPTAPAKKGGKQKDRVERYVSEDDLKDLRVYSNNN